MSLESLGAEKISSLQPDSEKQVAIERKKDWDWSSVVWFSLFGIMSHVTRNTLTFTHEYACFVVCVQEAGCGPRLRGDLRSRL